MASEEVKEIVKPGILKEPSRWVRFFSDPSWESFFASCLKALLLGMLGWLVMSIGAAFFGSILGAAFMGAYYLGVPFNPFGLVPVSINPLNLIFVATSVSAAAAFGCSFLNSLLHNERERPSKGMVYFLRFGVCFFSLCAALPFLSGGQPLLVLINLFLAPAIGLVFSLKFHSRYLSWVERNTQLMKSYRERKAKINELVVKLKKIDEFSRVDEDTLKEIVKQIEASSVYSGMNLLLSSRSDLPVTEKEVLCVLRSTPDGEKIACTYPSFLTQIAEEKGGVVGVSIKVSTDEERQSQNLYPWKEVAEGIANGLLHCKKRLKRDLTDQERWMIVTFCQHVHKDRSPSSFALSGLVVREFERRFFEQVEKPAICKWLVSLDVNNADLEMIVKKIVKSSAYRGVQHLMETPGITRNELECVLHSTPTGCDVLNLMTSGTNLTTEEQSRLPQLNWSEVGEAVAHGLIGYRNKFQTAMPAREQKLLLNLCREALFSKGALLEYIDKALETRQVTKIVVEEEKEESKTQTQQDAPQTNSTRPLSAPSPEVSFLRDPSATTSSAPTVVTQSSTAGRGMQHGKC